MITPYTQHILAKIGIVRYVPRSLSNTNLTSTQVPQSSSTSTQTTVEVSNHSHATKSSPSHHFSSHQAALSSSRTKPISVSRTHAQMKSYKTLLEIEEDARHCQRCDLCKARKNVVPGVGDHNANWLFVGEGPGAEEDAQGLPFVGSSGKLLNHCLAAAGLQRDKGVYITNAVKCRPPANRTPTLDEIASCLPFLEQQINVLQPKIIVAVGRTATLALLKDEKTPLGRMRQTVHHWQNPFLKTTTPKNTIPVVVTYHPSYLLRNLTEKKKSWQDICFAFEVLRRT